MNLIESSVGLIDIKNPFMKIEKVGRTCYKSTSEMTEDTARKFYKSLVERQHTAMLEHATFVFQVSENMYDALYGHKFLNYSVEEFGMGRESRYIISGNLRAINEIGELSLLSCLYEIDPDLVYNPDFKEHASRYRYSEHQIKVIDIDQILDIQPHAYRKHKYLSFHFICDRGVSHEIVRHRPASYAQESTRYCNYSKDKFGSEITCIKPADYDNWSDMSKAYYRQALISVETAYLAMLGDNRTPQEARAVLPNTLKTEVIMTANCDEFEHFFNLRSRGTTGAPHPDMKVVADKALQIYRNIPKPFEKCAR